LLTCTSTHEVKCFWRQNRERRKRKGFPANRAKEQGQGLTYQRLAETGDFVGGGNVETTFKKMKWLPVLHTIRTERMKDIRALAMVFPNGFKASFDQAA
jgi:hypothetical protein